MNLMMIIITIYLITIVISEKHLDFTAFNNDEKLKIPGHTLIHFDSMV